MNKHLPTIAAVILVISSWSYFAYAWEETRTHVIPRYIPVTSKLVTDYTSRKGLATSTPERHKVVETVLPAIKPVITQGSAHVSYRSPKIFSYAHGTAQADGKIFIGMARSGDNPFSTNEMIIFGNENDLSHPTLLAMPIAGDIETMVYDGVNDKVYFLMSKTGGLNVYSIDPHTYAIDVLASTTEVDAGRKPAITTDGVYVYGITDTEPSTVFKIALKDEKLTYDRKGHISNGHAAALGMNRGRTELYFDGGMTNGFEKVDAVTLHSIAKVKIEPCAMSDDMPYIKTDESSGYVYVGCEIVPYGLKINTKDLSYERFTLPGASLGLFSYGPDLYNASQDGNIDVFPQGNLTDLRRYKVSDQFTHIDTNGQDLEPNEIFHSSQTGAVYFTAWFGVKGLYQIATSTVVR